jgi:hypothetical protein
MNMTENLTSIGSPAIAPQPINQIITPIKFPAQTQEKQGQGHGDRVHAASFAMRTSPGVAQ